MKYSFVALAAWAVCGVASAQSSVTLFGVVDAAVRGTAQKSENRNPFSPITGVRASRTELANSGLSSSRLGFRGTEDLGGGLAAGFWLEAPITNDDGATGVSSFSRRSTVSLSGNFGEVRIGRDYTPEAQNDSQFDPFGDTGIGGTLILDANEAGNVGNVAGTGFGSNGTYKRASNMVQFYLPKNLGGFYGNVAYALHERARSSPDTLVSALDRASTGRHVGARVGYANGPLDVSVGYGQSDTVYSNRTGDIKSFNVGASYDFGVAKLFGLYSQSKDQRDPLNLLTVTPEIELKGYLVGVTVPVGVGLIRATYAQVRYDNNVVPVFGAGTADPKADKIAVGYVHNLSKRTALFATVARVSNKNGAGLTVGAGPAFTTSYGSLAFAPKTSTGYEIGVRHAF